MITASAIGFVYLYVVPQLESSLTAEKLRRLERVGGEQQPRLADALESGAPQDEVKELVRSAAQATESRVTLLAVRESAAGPEPSFVIADSQVEGTAIQSAYVHAGVAVDEGRVASGVERVAGAQVATSALPIELNGETRWVEVLTSSLEEVTDDVALVRRQILIAGGIALALASLIGFWASGAVSRRLHRMREAAEAVADGRFDQPIPIESSDELGQLARSFNEMQRRLARLDSSRKEFIANASHELRTPIFSLGGFVELLETENPSATERKAFVAEMRGQIERLQKLTIDLLDLSRLDADVMEIKRERVDLTDVATQVATEFRPAAKTHGSRLQVRGRGQVVALADADRVSQIIRILIDNALTHTPEGTNVTVTAVRAQRSADLIVGDDAKKGIDARTIDKVFDRFYTGDTASGSGLGLAIADELATRMGGKLEVASRRGHTAFTLSLPPAERPRRAREPAEAAV
ncbi:MAG TPA: HAMP domain-containing sensor histidine kinase [Solirubrobacterales bacterium]|nr:HAMP domain-containing sensor histidine kinase [Solirubrobacterales bacterium]